MKNLLLILSFLFLVSSCSNDEPFTEPDNKDDVALVKLQVCKQDANIFERLRFRVNTTESQVDMSEYYDSLVWTIPEYSDATKKIWTYPNYSDNRDVEWSWEVVFYKDGKYHTILKGFKEGEVVMSDTLIVNVTEKRDFLGFNWKDITKRKGAEVYYDNYLIYPADYVIYIRQDYLNSIPLLELLINQHWSKNEDEEEYMEKEQEKMTYDYISKLYGEPKLNYQKDAVAIATAYKAFKHKNDNYSPRYYWETNTSCIFLIKKRFELHDYQCYIVQAEPKK